MERQLKPEHLEQRETKEQLEQEESTRSSRSSFLWPQWAPVTVTTESNGGDARAITANDVSMSMPSLSRSFKSPDVRQSFLYHAVMTASAQASASLNTCCSLANSDSESTDTPDRAAGRERTEAHAPEFELLAGALFCAVSPGPGRGRDSIARVCGSRIEKGGMPFPPTGAPNSPSHSATLSAVVSKLPPFQSNLLVSCPQMLKIGKIGKIGKNCQKCYPMCHTRECL